MKHCFLLFRVEVEGPDGVVPAAHNHIVLVRVQQDIVDGDVLGAYLTLFDQP